ncbi:MAG TPA: EamA family transporter RarD [Phycisphaerae bacterium]|nr:EamA family transporter RarD [Phycisphaerae bacterium]HNU46254.1 EamA family transporter RarD [Phycisphaerae bacterium]
MTQAAADVARLDARAEARLGVLFGLGAYGLWGVFPLYFKAIAQVPALEVLAHRIVWSVLLLVALVLLQRRGRALLRVLAHWPTALALATTTVLIALNWFVFIWAVANNHVLQSSLGYFINPLVNVLLGFVFLRERLRRGQVLAVALAAVGVGLRTWHQVPWIALVLAGSFGFYGLLRKVARVDALLGLTVETALLAPWAAGYLLYLGARGDGAFGAVSPKLTILLLLAGVITAVPLLWFTHAAKRLTLTTLGFLQYLAPTGHFLLAVLAFGEPFTRHDVLSFALIWSALGIYSADAVQRGRQLAPVG